MEALELAAEMLGYVVRVGSVPDAAEPSIEEVVTTFVGGPSDVEKRVLGQAVGALLGAGLVTVSGSSFVSTQDGSEFVRRMGRKKASGQAAALEERLDGRTGAPMTWPCSDELWSLVLDDRRRFRLLRCSARLSVVEAWIEAIDNWTEVSDIVGASADRKAALEALMSSRFLWSEAQVHHILDMPLGRRSQLGRRDLVEEAVRLREELARI